MVGKLCGNRSEVLKNDIFYSTGDTIVVTFTSDVAVESRGFQANFEAICNQI